MKSRKNLYTVFVSCFALLLSMAAPVAAEESEGSLHESKITGNAQSVYVGGTVMNSGDYLLYNEANNTYKLAENTENLTVGSNNCAAKFADGVLTLGGTATFAEQHDSIAAKTWGVIGAVNPRKKLKIELMDNANITLNSNYYSGIYGNYAPVLIDGCGRITINVNQAEDVPPNTGSYGIEVYCDTPVDTAVTVTNGAHVSINGSGDRGISFDGSAAGKINVSLGGALEAAGMPVTNAAKDMLTVTDGFRKIKAGADSETATEYERDSLPEDLGSRSYMLIDTGSGVYIRDVEMIKDREYTYVNTAQGQNRKLIYDENTQTLRMSGKGEVTGSDDPNSERFGAAIGAVHNLTIELVDGADITVTGGVGSHSPVSDDIYACALYAYGPNANLTIKGNGKLTVVPRENVSRTDAIMSWDTNPMPADPNQIKENVVIESSVELIALGGAAGHGIATYADNSLYQHGWAVLKGVKAYIYGGDCAVLVHTDNGLLRDKDGNPNTGYTMDKATVKAAKADGTVIGYNGLELTQRIAEEDGKEIKENLFGEKYKYLWIKPQEFYEVTRHIGIEEFDTTDHHYIDDEELTEERKTGVSTGFVTEITPITTNPDEMVSFTSLYWKFQYYPAEGVEETTTDSTWNGKAAGYKFSRKFLFPDKDYMSHGEELFPIEKRMETTATLQGGAKLFIVVMVDGLCKDTAILEKVTDGNNNTIYPPSYPPTAVIY